MAEQKCPGQGLQMSELRPTLVRLPPDLHDAIKALAVAEERTMAQEIRRALRLYVGGVGDG